MKESIRVVEDTVIYYLHPNIKIISKIKLHENGDIQLIQIDATNYEYDTEINLTMSKDIQDYLLSNKGIYESIPKLRDCSFCEKWFYPCSKNTKFCGGNCKVADHRRNKL